jgi:hypothetical protein
MTYIYYRRIQVKKKHNTISLDAQLVILEKSGRLTPQTKIKTKSFGEQEDQMA